MEQTLKRLARDYYRHNCPLPDYLLAVITRSPLPYGFSSP